MASQLTKAQIGALLQGAYGQFEYKIRWKLTAPLANNADGVIVQKVTITYSIKDAQDQAINISTYTNNNCMWETHKEYWEAWYIRAGMLQPTYVGDNPSFDQTAIVANDEDDSYSAGEIQNHLAAVQQGQQTPKGITKGWVRYLGAATLYRVPDLDVWSNTWRTLFQEYNINNAATPAATLPYTANDPHLPVNAREHGLDHNMVAYWVSTNSKPHLRLTKIETDRTYNDTQLELKVAYEDRRQKAQQMAQQNAAAAASSASSASSAAAAAAVNQRTTRSGRVSKENSKYIGRYSPYSK